MKNKTDFFAQLASLESETKSELTRPEPCYTPVDKLPTFVSVNNLKWPKYHTIRNEKDLKSELTLLKKKYKPFFSNHSPKASVRRNRSDIKQFHYRVHTAQDDYTPLSSLKKKGHWEDVSLPHYGGPVGVAKSWYIGEIEIQDLTNNSTPWICFQGVDYKCALFINNHFVGTHEGFFSPFEWNLSTFLKPGKNSVTILVENDLPCTGTTPSFWEAPPADGDKIYAATGLGWDDPQIGWHHCPPGMGIYRPIYLEWREDTFVNDIFVRPLSLEKDLYYAQCRFEIIQKELHYTDFHYRWRYFGLNFKLEKITWQVEKYKATTGKGRNTIHFDFTIPNAKVWSPDSPWLYGMEIEIISDKNKKIDSLQTSFGLRTFQQDLAGNENDVPVPQQKKGMFYLNNLPIKLRGANTMGNEQQSVFKGDKNQLVEDLLLAKVTRMNFLRITQRPVEREVYEVADRIGLMLQCDFPLFKGLSKSQYCEALRQTEEMERLVRRHPSVILCSLINEPFSEAMGLNTCRNLNRNELLSWIRSAEEVIHYVNPERVIKPIDGDYDPPGPGLPDNHCYNLWYNGHGLPFGEMHKGYWLPVKPGWYYGCGEFGTEGLDDYTLMKKKYPAAWLPQKGKNASEWTPLQIKDAQSGRMYYNLFEKPSSITEWIEKTRAHQSMSTKLQTEALRRDNRMITFAIHLFIDAFPAGWMKSIMTCERKPKPAWYIYREALAPIAVQIRTDRFHYYAGETVSLEVWICNDTLSCPLGTSLVCRATCDSERLFNGKVSPEIPLFSASQVARIEFTLPHESSGGNHDVIVEVSLVDEIGTVIHSNNINLDYDSNVQWKDNNATVITMASQNPLYCYTISHSKNMCQQRDWLSSCGLTLTNDPRVAKLMVVFDVAEYYKNESLYLSLTERGANLIFMELLPGTWKIADEVIEVLVAGMRPKNFVARAKNHPLAEQICEHEMKFWFDPTVGYITPFLKNQLHNISSNWTPILTSGNGTFHTEWIDTHAVTERDYGKGKIFLCQLEIQNRTRHNPAAQKLAFYLFSNNTPEQSYETKI